MKTFKQFLADDQHSVNGALADAITKIKERCSKFLHEADGAPMFRGFMKKIDGLTELAVRKNRNPRDTNDEAHKAMDGWFNREYGIKPRSQGLFCSGNAAGAKKYTHDAANGSTCLIFPIGEFEYLWATKRDGDAVHDSAIITGSVERTIDLYLDDTESAQIDSIQRIMTSVNWHQTGLFAALHGDAEVVILCDHYYALPIELIDHTYYSKIFG